MRVVVTGQVGLDKKPFLARAAEIARDHGQELSVFNVGSMMYAEAPDVAPGKILDLPLSRLNNLRRSVLKDILAACRIRPNVVVNTHATFRWRHGLFYAFDYDQMKALAADLYVVLVDNIDRVHHRLVRDGHVDHTLKDLMVWREEEILATELLSRIVSPSAASSSPGKANSAPGRGGRFFILARGEGDSNVRTFVKLICGKDLKKAYLSFPMTYIDSGRPPAELPSQIEPFRREMRRHFICFDPGDLEEKHLAAL
ncbi:MAG: AAA family ATPase, partial [Planctomycetota bacterium]